MKKVFTNYYKDLRKIRNDIDYTALSRQIKKSLIEFERCMDFEEYYSSFLIIQSLLEDRINVLYRIYYRCNHRKPIKENEMVKPISFYIDELYNNGWIKDNLHRDLIMSVKIRNSRIHYTFMTHPDDSEIDRDLCKSFYELFRNVDSLIIHMKRSFNINNSRQINTYKKYIV